MKKKYSALLLIFILLLAGCFTISASGIKIPYLENYGTNFRRNVKGITDRLGLNLPQPVNDFLSKTPEPLSTEEKLAIIEKMESSDFFIVNYATEEVIYPKGYKHTDGNTYYKLSQISELE